MSPDGVTRRDDRGVVLRLAVHPVKGARAVRVAAMDLDQMGPRHDRRWMVVDPAGVFVSQRAEPRLATLAARVAPGALILEDHGPPSPDVHGSKADRGPRNPDVSGPSSNPETTSADVNLPSSGGSRLEPVSLPLTPQGERLRVRVWDSEVEVVTVSREADEWLSDFLGRVCRLVHMGDDDVRRTDPAYAQGHRVGFADGYPLLVVSQASVDEVSRRAGRPIPWQRFRPNLVVGGVRPHAEDRWLAFSVGRPQDRPDRDPSQHGANFLGVKLCARCRVTTVDQRSGEPDPEREPLRALARYRRVNGQVCFGLNAVHLGTGRITVGDPVRVTREGFIPNA